MIDYTPKLDMSQPHETIQVLTAVFFLSKEDILEALKYEKVHINGTIYETPREQLKHCVANEMHGEIELELREVKP